jgi:tRNA1(Val) A37 N6-methylase TrmN6
VEFVGIERDSGFAALAQQNVELNGQSGRARILEADALAHADFGVFDHVFFNPPYDNPGEGRAPAEGKRAAYLADRPIGDWIKVWSNRMCAHATLTLIHRAHRLGEILDALEGRLGGVEVAPIYPNAADHARRVIVRARKGSRAPLQILRGLVLHLSGDAKYTPEADALLRGEAHLWFG